MVFFSSRDDLSKNESGMHRSAGLLPFRQLSGHLQVMLVHPGGPNWAKKDDGAWSIATGEFKDDEEPLQVAKREFTEETGVVPTGELIHCGRPASTERISTAII